MSVGTQLSELDGEESELADEVAMFAMGLNGSEEGRTDRVVSYAGVTTMREGALATQNAARKILQIEAGI